MTYLSQDQANLVRAAGHVQQIADAYPLADELAPNLNDDERARRQRRNRDHEAKRKAYGSLCHSFPVLVRRSGLIQAVGFLEAKSAGESPSKEAYTRLLPHVREIVGVPPTTPNAALWLARQPLAEVMVGTQRLLNAWIHYKHFAESMLGISSAADTEEE